MLPTKFQFIWCLFYTLQVGIHILIFFLANLAKGNIMSFCHHLVSVVCHPFTFHILIFSKNPQPNELKLGRKHLWKGYRTFHTCRCFLPSFGSYVAKQFQKRFFRNRPIRNKNCMWWPCLRTLGRNHLWNVLY
jgi:hypothetical protein